MALLDVHFEGLLTDQARKQIISDDDFSVIGPLLRNGVFTPDEVELLTRSKTPLVRAHGALWTTDLSVQASLLDDDSIQVVCMLLLNPNLEASLFARASFCGSYAVRASLAALRDLEITGDFSARWASESKPRKLGRLIKKSGVDPEVTKILLPQWEGSITELIIAAGELSKTQS